MLRIKRDLTRIKLLLYGIGKNSDSPIVEQTLIIFFLKGLLSCCWERRDMDLPLMFGAAGAFLGNYLQRNHYSKPMKNLLS